MTCNIICYAILFAPLPPLRVSHVEWLSKTKTPSHQFESTTAISQTNNTSRQC